MPPGPGRPTPGPSSSSAPSKSPLGDALYNWARTEHEPGYVLTQTELLDSGLIPQKDVNTLLEALKYLVGRRLFKPHDIKGQQGVGYELVEEATAAK